MVHPFREGDALRCQILAVVADARLKETLERGLPRHGCGFTALDSPEALRSALAEDCPGHPERSAQRGVEGSAGPSTALMPNGDRRGSIDVVLFDVAPALNERILQVIEALRREGSRIPVACLVGAGSARALTAPQAGIALTLRKPIDLAELAFELGQLARR